VRSPRRRPNRSCCRDRTDREHHHRACRQHPRPRRTPESPRCPDRADLRRTPAGGDHSVHARPESFGTGTSPAAAARCPALGKGTQVACADQQGGAEEGAEARRTGNLHRPLRYSRPLRRHVFYLSAQTSMIRPGPNRDYYLKKRGRGATHSARSCGWVASLTRSSPWKRTQTRVSTQLVGHRVAHPLHRHGDLPPADRGPMPTPARSHPASLAEPPPPSRYGHTRTRGRVLDPTARHPHLARTPAPQHATDPDDPPQHLQDQVLRRPPKPVGSSWARTSNSSPSATER
jgi:hypothetical protein